MELRHYSAWQRMSPAQAVILPPVSGVRNREVIDEECSSAHRNDKTGMIE